MEFQVFGSRQVGPKTDPKKAMREIVKDAILIEPAMAATALERGPDPGVLSVEYKWLFRENAETLGDGVRSSLDIMRLGVEWATIVGAVGGLLLAAGHRKRQ